MNRRHLLTMGGAGVAALALPSFLPGRTGGGGTLLAQSGADPIARELGNQFSQIVAGLAANPPRGNARQIATTLRLSAAYVRATNLDAQLRQKLDAAIAAEGHQAFVTRIVERGRVAAEARRQGLTVPTPPGVQPPTFVNVAKAIGMLKADWTVERMLQIGAAGLIRNSARFDRQMAIRNGRPADAIIRRVQGTDYVSCLENGGDAETCNAQFPADTCTINPDGSATCSFVAGTPSPTAPNGQPWPSQEECNNYSFYIGIFQIYFGLVWFFFPEAWFLMAGWEAAFAWLEWYVGCA